MQQKLYYIFDALWNCVIWWWCVLRGTSSSPEGQQFGHKSRETRQQHTQHIFLSLLYSLEIVSSVLCPSWYSGSWTVNYQCVCKSLLDTFLATYSTSINYSILISRPWALYCLCALNQEPKPQHLLPIWPTVLTVEVLLGVNAFM